MKRVAVILCVLFLCACSSRTAVLFVTSVEWDVWGRTADFARKLSAEARARGYTLAVNVLPVLDQAAGPLTRALSRSNPPVVIASPLLSKDASDAASRAPGSSAILIGGAESAAGSGILRIVFDRREAFRIMGWATALSLKDSGGKVGILIPRSRWDGEAEIEAFTQGLFDGGSVEAPIERELPEPLDKAVVQKAVTEMRGQGVEVFLPRLGEMNDSCLEALKTSGGSAVTEDWEATGGYPGQVFLSVEEDVISGVGEALAALGGEERTVYGPVKVACGKARSVPAAVREKVTCQ